MARWTKLQAYLTVGHKTEKQKSHRQQKYRYVIMRQISQKYEIAQNFTARSIMTLDLWQIINSLVNYLITKVN